MKKLALFLALFAFSIALIGCGSETTTAEQTTSGGATGGAGIALPAYEGEQTELTIWVGTESKDFYQDKVNEYVATFNGSYPFTITVEGVDTGSAAATFLDDIEAGADIFTIAHDNLGKLVEGTGGITPIMSEELQAQVLADNPQNFIDVAQADFNEVEYTFGIPYIAQSLVLYYNTDLISETQVQSWEGILEAAEAADAQAVSLTGTDGFNNSFLLLSTRLADHSSTLQLYEDGVQENCLATGDDTVAVMKWGQRFFNNPNGAKRPTDSGWEVELKDDGVTAPISLSVIGGAWNFSAAQAALGDKLGIATLPTFTLTEADAYGTAVAGTVYKSGSFADTKMFVMKKGTDYQLYLEDILLFLSSKEVQEESFDEVQNLPAYKNAISEFEGFTEETLAGQLAIRQTEMFDWGIPQPFGAANKYNFYYYSKGGPDLLLEILENPNGDLTTDQEIYDQLYVIETIWKTGNQPAE